MQHSDDHSAADLREELSPVSERYAAVALGAATVVFDVDDPTRWVLSDTAHTLEAMR